MTPDERTQTLNYTSRRLEVLSERLRVGSLRMIGLQQMTRETSGELHELAETLSRLEPS